MRLTVRNIVKNNGEERLLNGVSYTFCQGKVYAVGGNEASVRALFDCIAFESTYESGSMELNCSGKNCLAPAMVGQFPEEPAFPEFLTVKEFLKYYIDINRRYITEPGNTEDYLALVELNHIGNNRMIRDFTFEERVRLQFLCFLIVNPPVLIINNIRNISSVDFLKDIKTYIDALRENSIILLGTSDNAVAVYLGDEQLVLENGSIKGGA